MQIVNNPIPSKDVNDFVSKLAIHVCMLLHLDNLFCIYCTNLFIYHPPSIQFTFTASEFRCTFILLFKFQPQTIFDFHSLHYKNLSFLVSLTLLSGKHKKLLTLSSEIICTTTGGKDETNLSFCVCSYISSFFHPVLLCRSHRQRRVEKIITIWKQTQQRKNKNKKWKKI